MTRQPARAAGARRVLGNDPAAVGFVMLALLITAGILSMQMSFRSGVYEPESIPIFYRLFLFEDYPAAFLFMLVLPVAALPALQGAAVRLAGWFGERPVLISVATCVVLSAGSLWVYHAHPLSMDEAAPYLQSKIFAQGALVGKYPPQLLDWLVYPPFQDYFIHVSKQTGEVASSYWPGFALLLTPFMALGVPWLCNPVLGAASVWVIHQLTLRITESKEAAGAATLFALASAAFVINAISFYSMTAHLLANGIFALLLMKPTPARVFTAGLVGGLALSLHNPVPHMLFAAPWLLWLLTSKNRWTLIAAITAGYLPLVIVLGFGWVHLLNGMSDGGVTATTASPLQDAVTRLANAFKLPQTLQLWDRGIALAKFWLWAAPLSILLAAMGFWRHRQNTFVRLLLASLVLTFVGYVFVPLNQGHGWGFRYLHSAWFVLPVLAAAALVPAGASTGARLEPGPLGRWTVAAALAGLFVLMPCFAWQVHAFIRDDLAQTPRADHGRARVVLINPGVGYYAQDLVQNEPFLGESLIRMVARGPAAAEDREMMAREFPDLVMLAHSVRGSVWGYEDPLKPTR